MQKKTPTNTTFAGVFNYNGGDGEIRTLAPVTQPTPLAGEPLIATWVRLHLAESQGFEPWKPFGLPVFKTGAIDQLGQLSKYLILCMLSDKTGTNSIVTEACLNVNTMLKF